MPTVVIPLSSVGESNPKSEVTFDRNVIVDHVDMKGMFADAIDRGELRDCDIVGYVRNTADGNMHCVVSDRKTGEIFHYTMDVDTRKPRLIPTSGDHSAKKEI